MSLEEALLRAKSGRALLFVGAGFSFTAVNIEGEYPPGSRELSRRLARLAGLEEEDEDLRFTSQYFYANKGPHQLVDLLKRLYTIKEVSQSHTVISSHKWRRIYTTNYDNAIELASRKADMSLQCVTPTDSPRDFSTKSDVCIHINGSIERITADSLDTDFKLTRSSYVTPESFEESPWFFSFQNDLAWCSAIFFVGYSLYDIEIEKLLRKFPEYKEKTFFILGSQASLKNQFLLSSYGKVLPIGIEPFAAALSDLCHNEDDQELWLDSFEVYQKSETCEEITDSEIRCFLQFGRLAEEFVRLAITSRQPKPYLVRRDNIEKVAETILKGHHVIIHSEFGNGKSVFCQQLAAYLSIRGENIFFLVNPDGDYIQDLEKIKSGFTSALLVIDGYAKHRDLVKFILANCGKSIRIILAERTYDHDRSTALFIQEQTEVMVFDINNLSNNECESFISIIDNIAGWAPDSRVSIDWKRRQIQEKCKRQISNILFAILDAPQIKDRVSSLISGLISDLDFKNTIFAICLLQYLGIVTSQHLIAELAGNDKVFSAELLNNPSFNQLFAPTKGIVQSKSSIFSVYLVKSFMSASYIADRLLYIAGVFNNLVSNGFQMEFAFKCLLRLSFLEKIMPESHKRTSYIKYYENLKISIPWLKGDPNYWLQYGMARLMFKEFDFAQSCLTQAYSVAKSKSYIYKTDYIDAQQARLYIEMAVIEADSLRAFELFKMAHSLLCTLADDVYKFRQVMGYGKIYELHYTYLPVSCQADFIRCCIVMRESADRVISNDLISINDIIVECRDRLHQFIHDVDSPLDSSPICLQTDLVSKQIRSEMPSNHIQTEDVLMGLDHPPNCEGIINKHKRRRRRRSSAEIIQSTLDYTDLDGQLVSNDLDADQKEVRRRRRRRSSAQGQ
jgi:hypothetical protein